MQECHYRRPSGLDRGGQAVQLGDVGLSAPVVEPVEPGADLGVIGAVSGGGSSWRIEEPLYGHSAKNPG